MAEPLPAGWTEEPLAPPQALPAGWTEEPAAPEPLPSTGDASDELAPLLQPAEAKRLKNDPLNQPGQLSDPYVGERKRYEREQLATDDPTVIQARALAYAARNATSDPGKRASVLAYAAASGLPPDVVEANYDDVKSNTDARKVDWLSVARTQPAYMATVGQNPAAMPILKEDLASLGGVEWALGSFLKYSGVGAWMNTLSRVAGLPGDSAERALTDATAEQVVIGRQFGKAFGLTDAAYDAKTAQLAARYTGQDYGEGDRTFPKAVLAAFKFGPMMAGQIASVLGGGAAGVVIGGGAGAETGPGAIGTGVAGGGTGAFVGGALFNYYQTLGPIQARLESLRDANGEPLPSDMVTAFSQSAAGIDGLLMAGLGKFLPGVGGLLGDVAVSSAEKALAAPAATEIAKKVLVTYGKDYLGGVALMAGVSAVNHAHEEGALVSVGGHFDAEARDRLTSGIAADTVDALQSFLLLSAIGPGREMFHEIGVAKASADRSAQLEAAVGSAKMSKLLELAPQTFHDFVKASASDDGAVATVFHPIEAWNSYWQAEKVDPADVAAHVAGDGGAAYKATPVGGDLAIPVEKWLTTFGEKKNPHTAALLDFAKTRPEDSTPRQAKAASIQLAARMEKEFADRKDEIEADKKEISKLVVDQAVAANIPKEEARAGAKLIAENAATMAVRLSVGGQKVSVREAAARGALGGLRFTGPNGETASAAVRAKLAEFLHPNDESFLLAKAESLSPDAKVREAYVDKNTGGPNARAFHESPAPEGKPYVAHFKVEGIKYANDTVGHEKADLVYRAAAKAIHDEAPGVAKVDGDFGAHVETPERAQEIAAKANASLPEGLRGFRITAETAKRGSGPEATGKAYEAAGKAHKETTDKAVLAGERANPRPLGPNGEKLLAERPKGLTADLKSIKLPEDKIAADVHPELRKGVEGLTKEQYVAKVLRNPDTGAYTSDGFFSFRRKAHVAALDVADLSKSVAQFGKAHGDAKVERLQRAAKALAGADFRFSRLHGDEFAAEHDTKAQLQGFLGRLAVLLEAQPVIAVDPATGKTHVEVVRFHYGLGERSYEAADLDLNRRKDAKRSKEAADARRDRENAATQAGRTGRDAGQSGPAARSDVGGERGGSAGPQDNGRSGGRGVEGSGQGAGPVAPGQLEASGVRGLSDSIDVGGSADFNTVNFEHTPADIDAQRAAINRKKSPERRAVLHAWLNFVLGEGDRPATEPSQADLVAFEKAGFVDPAGSPFAEPDSTKKNAPLQRLDKPLAGAGDRAAGSPGSSHAGHLWLANHPDEAYHLTPEERMNVEQGLDPARGGKKSTGHLQESLVVAAVEGAPVVLESKGRVKGPTAREKIEASPAFRAWFKDSKVVNAEGKPQVVYTGTSHAGFDTFSKDFQDPNGLYGPGFYFTEDPGVASTYSDKKGRLVPGETPGAQGVYPTYLSLKNPIDATKSAKGYVEQLRKFRAPEPPAEIKRMIDSALRDEPENFTIEGLGAWVDNTQWAYDAAERAGKNGEELLAPYFDYVVSRARDYMVREIRSGAWGTGDDIVGFIKRNVFRVLDASKGDANVQEVLKKLGFDGISHIGGNIMGDGHEHKVWIAFEPEQIKSAIGNRGTFDPNDSNILHAGDPKAPRGEIQLQLDPTGRPRSFNISILNGDKSTFLHEVSHFLSWSLHDIATSDIATPELKADYANLIKYAGFDTPEARLENQLKHRDLSARVRTPADDAYLRKLSAGEERISHAFEQYALEGKAPSAALARVFSKFRGWLLRIYKGVAGIQRQYEQNYGQPLELSDDVRGIFDRMLADDEALRQARRDQGRPEGPEPLVTVMTEAEAKARTQALDDAKAHEEQELAKRGAELANKHVEVTRAAIRVEVTRDLDAQPVYSAMRYLQHGEVPDGNGGALPELPETLRDSVTGLPFKVDRTKFVAEYGEQVAALMPPSIFSKLKDGGRDIEQLAPLLGFNDGAGLVEAFRNAEPRDRAIAKQTQDRVDAEYGPALQANAAAALDAVHNDAAARATVIELRALARDINKGAAKKSRTIDLATLKKTAQRLVASQKVGELDPDKYARTERQLALKAAELFGAGKKEESYAKREDRLFNQLLYRAAKDVQDSLDKTKDRLEGTSTEQRAKMGLADPSYRDAHDAVLEAVGLRDGKAPTGALETMLATAKEGGGAIDFDVEGIRALLAHPTPWDELTVDEAHAVEDAADNIRHVAKEGLEILIDGKKVERESYLKRVFERVASVRKQQPKPADDLSQRTIREKGRNFRQGLQTSLESIETIAHMVDGGDHGPMRELFVDGQRTARDAEVRLNKQVLDIIREKWAKIPKEIRKLKDQWVDLEGILQNPDKYQGNSYGRSTLWMLFLNWGNEGNRQRIRNGNGWADENVQKALNKLTKPETDFLQGILDATQSLAPEVAAAHERRTGLVLPMVEAKSITVNGETYRGGYWHLKYDPRDDVAAQINDSKETLQGAFSSRYVSATTPRGFTKTRLDKVNKRVYLQWSVVPAHLAQVIHDLTYGDWVRQAARIVLDKGSTEPGNERQSFASVFKSYLGEARYKELMPWLGDVANSRADSTAGHQTEALQTMGRFAVGVVGRQAIGLTFPFRHLFDPYSTMADSESIGPHQVAAAYLKVMDPRSWGDPLYHDSKALAHHESRLSDNLLAELNQIGTGNETMHKVNSVLFFAQRWIHHFTARVMFRAAYDQAVSNGKTHEEATKRGDDVVDRHLPSGDVAEKPPIMRQSNALAAAASVLYSYSSKMHNVRARALDDLWREGGSPQGKTAAVVTFAGKMLALGTVGAIGTYLAGRGLKKDDKEGAAEWTTKEILLDPIEGIPLIGSGVKKLVTHHKVDIASAPAITLLQETFDKIGRMANQSKTKTDEERLWEAVEVLLATASGASNTIHKTIGSAQQDRPRNPLDAAAGVLYGPKKNRSINPIDQLSDLIEGR